MNSPHSYPEYKLSPSRRQHNSTRHFCYLFNKCWKVGLDPGCRKLCITWKGRFFIPIVLGGHCLKALHWGHLGVTKVILRAKGSMFWPNINKDIAKYVNSCVPCQTISNSQQKEPAIPIKVPSRTWKVLGIDIVVQGNKYYLLIADYYSKFPYVLKISRISSKEVISVPSFCFFSIWHSRRNHLWQQYPVISKEYNEYAGNGDSPWSQAVFTIQEVMVSLRGKSRSLEC